MLRNLLVPVDGSTFGEHSLPLACTLARKAGAVLHLVHVHHVVPPTTLAGVAVVDTIDLHLRQDEQAYLADLNRRLQEVGPLQIKTALLDGSVPDTLKEYAEKINADLVLVSTHGRGAMGRFWLGSVADDLVRGLPRPVLLVRPHEGKPELNREVPLKTIVIPLDGTPLAEKVIPPVIDLSKLFESQIVFLEVIKPVLRPSYLPEGSSFLGLTHSVLEEIQVLQQRYVSEAESYLEKVAAKYRSQGLNIITRVVIDEQPAVGILLEAQVRHADLIAMETHGRRGLSRLLLGSVADKIIRGGVVPVLLNRPLE